ncbi:MAG: phosphate ABC transporter substrate-binding protein PstS [Pseudomonadota bacterium]
MYPLRIGIAIIASTALLLASCGEDTDRVRLTGSGASFPYPVYATWFKTYGRENPDVLVNYQAKGSGAGIRDLIHRTVDFAGSDAAMSDSEIAEVDGGVIMIPITAGKIVVAYNLPGVEQPLQLSRRAYPQIFLGRITHWNDPAIAVSNPGIRLPDLPITVVRRADSSGTTYAFTNHLTAASAEWRSGPGTGKTVVWPDSDKLIAAPKNDGVTATILQTPGAVGYIEYGYARFGNVPMAMLENQAGNYVLPGAQSGRAALLGAELPADLRIWIPDPAGDGAYPIVTYTWLLLRRRYDSARTAAALRELVRFCLLDGQALATELGYLTLPDSVAERSLAALDELR